MLYSLLKIYARLAIHIFCRKIAITNKHLLQSKGPLILAVNHPNSFLDAVILDILFDKPIYSLARGDAFSKKGIAKILRALNILPVYREREGKENLHRNYDTFDECLEIFRKDGIVLIFTEALCENEWHLRPLKKGTARLAATAWLKNIPVKILPIGLNYSSYTLFGKNIHVNIGNIIAASDLKNNISENGKLLNELTDQIEKQLRSRVYEIDKGDKVKQAAVFTVPVSNIKKILLSVPALLGIITHFILYWPVTKYAHRYQHTGHYDSMLTGLLFIFYPFFLLGWTLLLFAITKSWYALLLIILLSFFAWSYVQLSRQTD